MPNTSEWNFCSKFDVKKWKISASEREREREERTTSNYANSRNYNFFFWQTCCVLLNSFFVSSIFTFFWCVRAKPVEESLPYLELDRILFLSFFLRVMIFRIRRILHQISSTVRNFPSDLDYTKERVKYGGWHWLTLGIYRIVNVAVEYCIKSIKHFLPPPSSPSPTVTLTFFPRSLN